MYGYAADTEGDQGWCTVDEWVLSGAKRAIIVNLMYQDTERIIMANCHAYASNGTEATEMAYDIIEHAIRNAGKFLQVEGGGCSPSYPQQNLESFGAMRIQDYGGVLLCEFIPRTYWKDQPKPGKEEPKPNPRRGIRYTKQQAHECLVNLLSRHWFAGKVSVDSFA